MISKKNRFRVTAALLALTFAASLFTGCSKKEESLNQTPGLPSVMPEQSDQPEQNNDKLPT